MNHSLWKSWQILLLLDLPRCWEITLTYRSVGNTPKIDFRRTSYCRIAQSKVSSNLRLQQLDCADSGSFANSCCRWYSKMIPQWYFVSYGGSNDLTSKDLNSLPSSTSEKTRRVIYVYLQPSAYFSSCSSANLFACAAPLVCTWGITQGETLCFHSKLPGVPRSHHPQSK